MRYFAAICLLLSVAISATTLLIVKREVARSSEPAIVTEATYAVEARFGAILAGDPLLTSISYDGEQAYVFFTLTPNTPDPAFRAKVTLSKAPYRVTNIEPF